ncbi:MAG: DUF2934 domain-containing protein [Methylobacter sp.]
MAKKTEKPSSVIPCSPLSIYAISENQQWIAESAYYKALARNFTANLDLDDWLEAKKDYEALQLTQRKNGLVCLC